SAMVLPSSEEPSSAPPHPASIGITPREAMRTFTCLFLRTSSHLSNWSDGRGGQAAQRIRAGSVTPRESARARRGLGGDFDRVGDSGFAMDGVAIATPVHRVDGGEVGA